MHKKILNQIRNIWLNTEIKKIICASVLALALLIFLILSITSKNAIKKHEQTILNSCDNYTDFVMQRSETEINMLFNILYEFMGSPALASTKTLYGNNGLDNTAIEEIKTLIRSSVLSTDTIDDVIIYYPDTPNVLTLNGIYSTDYFKSSNPVHSVVFDMNKQKKNSIYMETHSFYMELENKYVEYLILYYVTDYYRANILVNVSDFMSLFDISHFYTEDMSILISNSLDEIILSSFANQALKEKVPDIIENKKPIFDRDYISVKKQSPTGYTYTVLYSRDIIKKDIGVISRQYIGSYILTLLIFIIFLILYNYLLVTPLKNFATNFLSASNSGKKNELAALLDYVDIMNKQLFEMSDYILYTKNTTTNALMINAILHNNANKPAHEYKEYEANFFMDSFPLENFVLVYFITGSFNENISTGLSLTLDKLDTKYEFCFISNEGFFAVINFDGSIAPIHKELEIFINNINKTEIKTVAIISEPVDNINMISECTKMIFSTKNSRNIKKKNKLYTKTDIAANQELLAAFVETEAAFQNIIKLGDKIKLRDNLDKIFSSHKDVSYGDCYDFFMYLHNFIIRYVSQSNWETEDLNLPFLEMLSKGNLAVMDYEKLKNAFTETCLELCNMATDVQNNYDDEIIKYIKDNYNKYISLDLVAQTFDLNSSYLSTYIKKKIGMSFVEYMRYLRITNARKLLTETEFDIAKIAEILGFSDASSFIRYFKKSEGITPKQYRSSNLEP